MKPPPELFIDPTEYCMLVEYRRSLGRLYQVKKRAVAKICKVFNRFFYLILGNILCTVCILSLRQKMTILFTPNMKYFDFKKFSNSKANHPVALTNPQILKNLYFVDF